MGYHEVSHKFYISLGNRKMSMIISSQKNNLNINSFQTFKLKLTRIPQSKTSYVSSKDRRVN